VALSIFEEGVPPRFRVQPAPAGPASVETVRPDGTRQVFVLQPLGDGLESADEVPEPHEFQAHLHLGAATYVAHFAEAVHAHGSASRDNNMRAAVVHVLADAAVSVLVIAGLLLARWLGWVWMDPVAGLIGAGVIASWAWGLVRDTGAILLDMNPDRQMADRVRMAIESDGDRLSDLHLWRLGPGHLGAILCVDTGLARDPDYYRARLRHFKVLSHLTIEVQNRA
jgi:cation diffusion facilitator family transporter